MRFDDRRAAGRQLAWRLEFLRGQDETDFALADGAAPRVTAIRIHVLLQQHAARATGGHSRVRSQSEAPKNMFEPESA